MPNQINFTELVEQIKLWGNELGFQQIGISDIDLQKSSVLLQQWLEVGFHGEMDYMQKHGSKRYKPAELVPGTLRVITVRLDYLPPRADIFSILKNPWKAFISRYALGRDYHKVLRKRLLQLTERIKQVSDNFAYRVFVDSAPVLEKPLAAKAGLGWMGKHTNLINKQAGSFFFLGTIYTDLPLPCDVAVENHCGSCTKCISICPTQAIIAPYVLDARRCISYLTIELRGSIPEELRPLIGNRIYGCDDCQAICPWNKFAQITQEKDFHPRHQLENSDLLTLFAWSEQDFLHYTEGSAIRRIGYECWLRNIAVALGNAPYDEQIISALKHKLSYPSPLVQEHVIWALKQHGVIS